MRDVERTVVEKERDGYFRESVGNIESWEALCLWRLKVWGCLSGAKKKKKVDLGKKEWVV